MSDFAAFEIGSAFVFGCWLIQTGLERLFPREISLKNSTTTTIIVKRNSSPD